MFQKKYRYDGNRDAVIRYRQSEKKTMSFYGKCFMAVVVIVCILIIGIIILYYNLVNNTINNIHYEESNVCTYDESDSINILILGTDGRTEEEHARSDMIMLCSINERKETIQFISFQRDLYVTIPGREGRDRLGHAFAYGKGELAVQTIEENFQIPIDGYVVVNLASSLYQVIDAFGGAKVEMTLEESGMINGYIYELNEITGAEYGTSYLDETTQGVVVLDGRQAISYARIRYIGTDIERTSRQREVIMGMLENLKEELFSGHIMAAVNLYTKLPNAASSITTSIPKEKLKKIVNHMFAYSEYKVSSNLSIPVAGDWWDFTTDSGMDVIEWNVDTTLEKLKNVLGIKKQ